MEKHKVLSRGTTDCCRKDTVINKNKQTIDDCVVLSRDGLEQDAVVIDDNAPRYLTLEVDGVTSGKDGQEAQPALRPDKVPSNEETAPEASVAMKGLGADGLDVYGWEPSLWQKIRGYLGF